MTSPERIAEHLLLPGVLTAEQAAETVAGILGAQHADGAIPWFRGVVSAGGHRRAPWRAIASR
ncbi:hypothetical protein [Streptomyces sp. MS191]|uniref:hypothetical protein n=1 Tax=Streptomyces sp. ms191 TaxID=1827978 RepID=UPI003967B366